MYTEKQPETIIRKALAVAPATQLPTSQETQSSLLNALLVQSRDVMLLVESDTPELACFRLVYANPAFVKSGMGKAMRGLTLRSGLTAFAEALSASTLNTQVNAALAHGQNVVGKRLVGRLDGQSVSMMMDIVPVFSSDIPRWLITLRDITEQETVAEALQQTQDRYRLLTESMADVVSLHDSQGQFLSVTPSIFRLTGYTVEETLACDARSIVHPDDREKMFSQDMSWEAIDANTYRVEWRRLKKDGSYLWLETTGTCIYKSDGQLHRVVCCSRDISRRKRSEAALQDERTLLRTLIDCLPDCISVKDHEGRYLLDNQAHQEFLHRSADEIIGKSASELFPPEIADQYEENDQQVLLGENIMVNSEEAISDPDGNLRWMTTTKTPLMGPEGSVAGLITVSRDITDRRETAAALKQSADKYRLLFQANPQPMWVYDVETLAFVAVNDTAVAQYGYSRREFLNMTLADIRPASEIPSLMQSVSRLSDEMKETGPWRHLRKDGTEIWVDIYSHGIQFNGRPARLIVANNVTERKRMEMVTEKLLIQTKRLLAEAEERSDRDPLTGLLNHRAFHKRLELEAQTALQDEKPLAIAMLDLDNFKFFNDAYGHAVGDDVLKQVTQALLGCCRPEDTLARFGGDEFALLMPGTDAESAVRQADRLTSALSGVGYCPPGYQSIIPLTLSIGIAIFPDDSSERLEALEIADARLIRVKNGGTGTGDFTDSLRSKLSCVLSDFAMLNALVSAVDNKDRYTRRHSEDVMAYSLQIAQELKLEDKIQEQIQLAALLHDVGKIGVPDRVLRKPGMLTAEEYEALKQHPMMGAIIVGAVPGFEETLNGIRHHHERWDGGGYPFGLKGQDIPLMARLMAVADAFSAMTTDRPYRKGMSDEAALGLLKSGSGTQWDPNCVEAFIAARLRREHWLEG